MSRCKIRRIKKGSGKYRLIYIPNAQYKQDLSRCSAELASILDDHLDDCLDHAFIRGRNCVTNARTHIGKTYVLSLDIEDFFDSIGIPLLTNFVKSEILDLVLEGGAPRQGLPTSPVVANIAMLDIDKRIRQLCESLGEISYSRYADDITVGFDIPSLRTALQSGIEAILLAKGLRLNIKKTLLQNSRNGAIRITGVSVVEGGVRPTRKTGRRIRAAVHQGNAFAAKGLIEWSKCKLPNKVMR